jgi:uncharacterized protein (TIGR00297 family)
MNESTKFFLILVGLIAFVAGADQAKKFFKIDSKKIRMFIHASVAVGIFFAPLIFKQKLYPALFGSLFTVFDFISIKLGLLRGINMDKKNLGTVYYPLSFLILVLLLWDSYPFIVSTAMLVMGLADPAAAIVGSQIKNAHEVFAFGERKTFEGSVAMFLLASIATMIGLLFFGVPVSMTPGPAALLRISVSIGIMAAAIELISPKAADNLTVPLSSGILLFIAASKPALFDSFMVAEFLAMLVAVVSARLKFLSTDGAVATFVLGSFIFGFGGWQWSVPILLFFIIGSVASKLFSTKKAGYNLLYEKSHERDSAQVFANGGIPLLMLICTAILPNYHWFLAYLGALSAVTADTLATEIGVFSRGDPFSIPLWKRVEKGASGGVSSLGTFTGMMSAALLASLTLPFSGGYGFFPVRFIIAGTISGATGSLADSLIGGTIQSQYRCAVCGKITERKRHCVGQETRLIQGYRWINNDVVNFASSIVGAISMPLLFF